MSPRKRLASPNSPKTSRGIAPSSNKSAPDKSLSNSSVNEFCREIIEDYLAGLTRFPGLRKFGKVVPNCGQNDADVVINTIISKSNSGSNETMQNVLAQIVEFWRIFEIFF